MTGVHHLVCAACGRPLTVGCRLGTARDYAEPTECGAAPVVPGVMVVMQDTITVAMTAPNAPAVHRLVSPAGSFSVNPADVLRDAMERSGVNNGCCDSDGCDGPNRSCVCGQVLATEWADCWTQAEIRFLPDAVALVAE